MNSLKPSGFVNLAGVVFALFSYSSHADSRLAIQICADPTPVAWTVSKNDKASLQELPVSSPVSGISPSIVTALFNQLHVPVKFIGDLPWKRCLAEVAAGHIDFAMGAYYNEERAKLFDYSNHYNTLTPQIFYLASNPVVVTNPIDLKRYRGCGLYGSSYAHYGLKSEDLDLGAGYDSLVRKLYGGRCDYFVEELEIIANFKVIGENILSDPNLKHVSAPWAKAPSRYLITAKNGKNSASLARINAALDDMIRSGTVQEIWKSQYDDIPYKP